MQRRGQQTMNIQPAITVGLTGGVQNAAGVTPGSAGQTEFAEGVRADWNVRMNISHENGFVGGAGRILIHNLTAEERREILLYLPAARPDVLGHLELASAVICSAKPGTQAAPGQTLAYRVEGARVLVTIPVLKMNDWLYIDLTWTGGFNPGGAQFPGGQINVGDFHPQLAVDVRLDDGRTGIGQIAARYEVELGSDLNARVRLESEEHGRVATRTNEDGTMTMHEFKSYGKPYIQAYLAPPGAILGPPSIIATQQGESLPAGPIPTLGSDAPQFIR
jgi:hypothetical protein